MTPPPTLSRAEADAALADADRAVADASASLVALEDHRGCALLRTWPLTGVSATRWAETAETIAELHADLGRYTDAVARARSARGTRARPSDAVLAETAGILHGPSIRLGTEAIPLQRRGLLGPAEVSTDTSPPALLARMTAAFDAATAVVAAAGAAWDGVAARLDPLDAACAALADAGVTATGIRTPARLADELTDLRRQAMGDPLSLDPADPFTGPAADRLSAVQAALDTLTERRDALAALRADLGDRLAALDAALDGLAAAEDRATDTAARVARAIDPRSTGEPPVPGRRLGGLRARRGELTDAVRTGRWATLLDAVVALERDVAAARSRADGDDAVLAGLLKRRADLRGLLGALTAKAAARGRAEDLDLDALRRAAEDLLWSAPCDLAAATVALRRYQRALDPADRTPPGREVS